MRECKALMILQSALETARRQSPEHKVGPAVCFGFPVLEGGASVEVNNGGNQKRPGG